MRITGRKNLDLSFVELLSHSWGLLNKYGFEVLSYKKRSYYYYVAYRKFDVAELRVLIDAVQRQILYRRCLP